MSTIVLLVLVGLLAVNRLVLSLVGYGGAKPLFWTIQFLNLAAVIELILIGLPQLPPGLKIVNYFIALVFMLHIVENNSRRVRAIKRELERESVVDHQDDRKAMIRERISRGEARSRGTKTVGQED